MPQSSPRIIFGVHSFTPYNRLDRTFYGEVRVLSSSSLEVSGELVELTGGSNRFPWDVQDGLISAELKLNVKEYPNFLFELFLGKAPTVIAASATSGTVSALANGKGTSAFKATTGIASVQALAASEADMKFGKYVIKVISATTVHVYAASDVDFQRGTDKDFEDDSLKITTTALTITAATPVTVPGFGITLTGGSGTIAMVVGDTAYFEVLPPHNGAMEVNIGATSDTFPEFGAIMIAQQKGNGEMFDVEAFRVKAIGLPLGLSAKEFSEAEITAKCFYDADKNSVLRIRHVKPAV